MVCYMFVIFRVMLVQDTHAPQVLQGVQEKLELRDL